MELYTECAYRTEDLDFVGALTKEVAKKLEQAGFERQGRRWVHDGYRLSIRLGPTAVVVLGLEEFIVDRLAAWQF